MSLKTIDIYLSKLDSITSDIKNIVSGAKPNELNNDGLNDLYLDFLLSNVYQSKLKTTKKRRLNQTEFRSYMFNKFGCCVITGETCPEELTAAHICPLNVEDNYDVDNGLLLRENLHRTFDKYKWSINPDTLKITINNNENVGEIRNYNNNKVNIRMNNMLYDNLLLHYNEFKNNLC